MTYTKNDVTFGDLLRDLALSTSPRLLDAREDINDAARQDRGRPFNHYRIAVKALEEGNYDEAIRQANLMEALDSRRRGLAAGIRNVAQNAAALEAQ